MKNKNSKTKLEHIRNFSIIAHIDHGKSTLADRLMEITGTVAKRDSKDQLLDSMELERERGITIKLTPVTMKYTKDGKDYVLNLIDTPGHVDFTYEVSRSLAACEGAVLVVDASQGVEAQTLANVYLALENDLFILPVINKIDLPSARPDEVKEEVEDVIGLDTSYAPLVSAKMGINIDQILDLVVDKVPCPEGDKNEPLQALIFDSYYDNYKGAICLVRIVNGSVKTGTKIKMLQTGKVFDVVEVGVFTPKPTEREELSAGEVGYIAASIKTVSDISVGDTIAEVGKECEKLDGYKQVMPVVYSGIFPVDGSKYNLLKDALEKLKLSDASLLYSPETSSALGYGFRCGFLGLLHMEIVTERLEREFNLDIITTAPSVSYNVYKTNGEMIEVSNPSFLPPVQSIDRIEEPIINASIYTPPEYVGAIMEIAQNKRGEFIDMQYLEERRVKLSYVLPLSEIVYDFFDKLKSASHGYASFDYEMAGYSPSNMVKLDILLNGDVCDALSLIVHRDKAYERGRGITEKLKEVVPRQLFEIPIQATIGGKVIARETVRAMRKDVIAKCYGGDISRKRKLLEKQKEGKKKMRMLGSVELPSEAFMSILKLD
ncbi:MAG: translation elongation factor 4 [Clostridia bacterium]|nr:translation elongation factor 4 [Clostridia bacterium]